MSVKSETTNEITPHPPAVMALIDGQIDFAKFDGNDEANLKHFLRYYSIYGADHQWSVEEQLNNFKFALTGKARLWFEEDAACQAILNGTSKEQAQYDQLVQLVKTRYKYIELKAMFNFAKAERQSGESIDDFLKRLEDLLEIYMVPGLRGWISMVSNKLSKSMKDCIFSKLGTANEYTSFDDFRYDMILVEEDELLRLNTMLETGFQPEPQKRNNHNRRRYRNRNNN